MIEIRKADERGHLDHGWLDTYHTFSFADYVDPRFMGFRALRVINEDRVAPGRGFPPHPHRDMEIITYVLEGAIAHTDNMGHSEVLKPGEVQRMTAGRGVVHAEYNASKTEPLHLYQIWIETAKKGLTPEYEQKAFPEADRAGRLKLLVSPDGADGSLQIHQDVRLYGAILKSGESVSLPMGTKRFGWVQVARGTIDVNGQAASAGDGVSIDRERTIAVKAVEPSEILLFDLN